METILEPLIRSPKLMVYYQQLGQVVSDEQKRRKQFYETMSEQEKVEFINGKIVRQSPVKIEHEFVSSNVNTLLRTYVAYHDLGYVGHEKMLISLTRNDYEPDVCYWRKAKAKHFDRGQMHFPAPDFVAEILSPSTEEMDRETKFQDYAAHGVQEYWIIDPAQEFVEQYSLHDEKYELVQKTDSGILRSSIIQGFRISVRALFDQQKHLDTLWEIQKSTRGV